MSTFSKVLLKFYNGYLRLSGASKNYTTLFKSEERIGFIYSRLKGFARLGYMPNLQSPKSFNEKSIHRRLFCRAPLWPIVTDKIAVRDWLTNEGVSNVSLMPVLYIIENVKSFDLSAIKEPVVIKAAWASGKNVFVQRPSEADWEEIRSRMLEWQVEEYAPERLVWAATQMSRKFIVEKMYSTLKSKFLEDYKFYVFHGKVELIQIITGREDGSYYAHFDRGINRLPVKRYNKKEIDENFIPDPLVNEMLVAAEEIGKYFDFARIDLYELEGKIYFGEITQCPANGYARFHPKDFDFKLGEKWLYPG